MKRLLLCLLGAAVLTASAREFQVNITPDGEASLTVFLPSTDVATGRAVVCCPGGGYSNLMMDYEGTDWAVYFNNKGIALCVLKYRMPKGNRQIPISDAYAAMKMVRDSAEVWHINAHDVGIMGFSAGGHLASTVSTHAPMELRPDFSILFYPVITMQYKQTHHGSVDNFLGNENDSTKVVNDFSNDKAVRKHLTPPAAVFLANDDDIVPILENGVAYFSAMHKVGNHCALYAYPSGGHGFGMKKDFRYHQQMLCDLDDWLAYLPSPKNHAVRVACIGNSITDGSGIFMRDIFGYPAQLQKKLGNGYIVKNFGIGGRTMLQKGDYPYMKEQAWKDAQGFQPDIVVIKLGTNDSKPKNWLYGSEFAKDMQSMLDTLKALPTHPLIYLATPIPALNTTGNISQKALTDEICPLIKDLAKKNKCELIDLQTLFQPTEGMMSSDGIHPTTKGAGQMAEIIYQHIINQDQTPEKPINFSKYKLKDVSALQSDVKQGYQGMCIYEDWLLSVQNKGFATLYKLPSLEKKTPTFKLGSFADTNHANVAAFGVEKFCESDPLPLVYVSQAYKKTVNGEKDVCYVERISLDGSSQMVQRIVLDDPNHLYGYALQWTIDHKHRHLIGFGNTISNTGEGNKFRIMVFSIPHLSDGEVVHLTAADAIENYFVQDTDDRYPSKVVGQGACVWNDCLLLPTGFGKEDAPSIVYILDLKTRKLRNILDLRDKLKNEMEDIDFYQGDAYIQTNGRGVVKLDYK
ncbi:MAG: alpha/beta hydrolase fold domain-containing protein [Bacteroidaceae bacterium]|nr:alpha/beta hydrolase fold domain-containing protein [Bacteroidaceae bacterium]MBR5394272.1 alpha/beta hydrolase fold domain-containing protein [Bacteroidaceae bacterium]